MRQDLFLYRFPNGYLLESDDWHELWSPYLVQEPRWLVMASADVVRAAGPKVTA